MDFFVKAILIVVSFSLGLGLVFLIFRLRSRSFVTGVVPPGPFPLQGKRRPKIGDYTILSELGRGGMGTVFKAVGRRGGTVAIKLIGGMGLDRRAGVRRRNRVGLVREARLAASLRHPNIVKVFDIRRENQTLYVIMEYLEGTPLSRHIRSQKPGVLEALRIVAEVCDALSYAHGRGVVHRDIKPANIFITAAKTVKVLDFGLAFQGDDRSGLAGTPPYMSPEQFIGKDVDARSDIWSTGVTLFETLTGDRPFVEENLPSLRMKIVDGSLPELPPGLPHAHELKAFLEKALSKDREARYQTAAEFSVDLRSLILKIQQADLDSPAIASPPGIHDPVFSWNLNNSSEQTLPPPQPMVNLGFKKQFRAPVFLKVFPMQELWFNAYCISRLQDLGSLVGIVGLLLFIIGTIATWGLALSGNQPAYQALIVEGLAAIFAMAILGAVVRLVYESVSPPEVLRCRSCQRKMRTASDWRRCVWSVDREGFCVADCLTALKEDNWEDAVTLFLLHTTVETLDTRYRLMFLECRSCRDQRAYFWFSPKPEYWDRYIEHLRGPLWSEAYKFFDPQKAEEFIKVEKLRTGSTPAISIKDTVDVRGQKTI
jgi:serine/threonine protein kinase